MNTALASIGFVLAVMTFIAGFRMIRRFDQAEEILLHRVNGYLTVTMYVILAVMSIWMHMDLLFLFLWGVGFLIHLLKILLARKGLAVRYGGYLGGMLLITWIIVIFTNLPS